jgi:Protein phosphatase 2C
MSWKVLRASARGVDRAECQDYHRVGVANGALIALGCDGAGSAKHASKGAQMAADFLFDRLSAFNKLPEMSALIQEARAELWKEAERLNEPLSAFATTLLGMVIREDEALFFQIGDGAIITWEEGAGTVVFWPKQYEYANQTAFLTDESYDLQVRIRQGACREAALLTDGLQMVALEYANRRVFENFFIPFKECLSSSMESGRINLLVEAFLNSGPVNSRTRDDKTLIVAKYEDC